MGINNNSQIVTNFAATNGLFSKCYKDNRTDKTKASSASNANGEKARNRDSPASLKDSPIYISTLSAAFSSLSTNSGNMAVVNRCCSCSKRLGLFGLVAFARLIGTWKNMSAVMILSWQVVMQLRKPIRLSRRKNYRLEYEITL
ncbi:hypothetical protein GIB67_041396 [Kingdonia uniflora]|uniref:Uncharacterized protein n=1 Tax=Kingdonia uniflora TaxID=39325 RepID=A0A7J7LRB9_9MAGN|nr:hypothetical protein GIB67_041396 [Kingdonia uniflora]